MKPISYKQEMGDMERLLCPGVPHGFLLVFVIHLQAYVISWCTAEQFAISVHIEMIIMISLFVICHHTKVLHS